MNDNNTSSSLGKFITLSCIVTILIFLIGNRIFYADSNESAFPIFSGLISNSSSDVNTEDTSTNEESEINADQDEQETTYNESKSEDEGDLENNDEETTDEEVDDGNDDENWNNMDTNSDDQPESGELDF